MRLTRTEKQAMADQVADPVAQICPLSCLKPDKPWQVTCSCFLSHWELIRFCCAPGSGEMNLIRGGGGRRRDLERRQDKGQQGDSSLCWIPERSWRRVE